MRIDLNSPEHAAVLECIDQLSPETSYAAQEQTTQGDLIKALFIDSEYSGLNPETDEVIELALILLSFDPTGSLKSSVIDSYHGFQTPQKPLEEDVVEFYGAGYVDKLAGTVFDYKKIVSLFKEADLLVSHNAKFEQPFTEKHWGQAIADKSWICTYADVNWSPVTDRPKTSKNIAQALGLPSYDKMDCVACAMLTMGIFLKSLSKFRKVIENRVG